MEKLSREAEEELAKFEEAATESEEVVDPVPEYAEVDKEKRETCHRIFVDGLRPDQVVHYANAGKVPL